LRSLKFADKISNVKRPEIDFNLQTLRDFAKDPVELKNYLEDLELRYDPSAGPMNQVSILGETGVYLRIQGELAKAQEKLLKAVEIVKAHNLGIRIEIQQKIRLAHVYQWKNDFEASNALFGKILAICQDSEEAREYQDFALQHAGKNFFDQERFVEAQICFEKAWELRKEKKAPKDLIQSSHEALLETTRRLIQGK
jgi:tetratricopeptide (TPR) repeat protein